MQTISQLLKAGMRTPFSIAGSVLLVMAADNGTNLGIRFRTGNAVVAEVGPVGASFKAKPPGGFTVVEFTAPVDTNVTFIVGDGDFDVQMAQLGVTVANTNANPVPVSIVSEPGQPFQVSNSGTPFHVTVDGSVAVTGATLTATNVGITQAGTITDNAPIAAPAFTSGTPNQVPLLAASAGRRRVAFKNAGAGIAYIGGVGVTPTNAVISLNPGDVWLDNDGAPAAWYGTSDVGTSINVQVMA
ncbi:hypothetical protein [Burkholderia sp. BCC1998]|uniref:hypothetical protein n=1 Tax=Burkholderia sp. BCC1998 TaxID=2817447 RepID=UPI002AB7493A|nr:hypothetical protein [Burkholderia sp. BCC1998]